VNEEKILAADVAISRRHLLAGSAAAAATFVLSGCSVPAADGRRRFTILHTNDMHSAFIGMGPASDYTPLTTNDDATRGGYSRLAALIARRREALQAAGPVLTLDGGDYSMGTPFGASTRVTGCELQVMARMGYDATTLGNHEFDLGPDGLGASIATAAKAGRIPLVMATNSRLGAEDPKLAELQRLSKTGTIRTHAVLERGGLRFGLIGLLGKEAQNYTGGAGAVTFADALESARQAVKVLRETEHVEVVIALSHGGVVRDKDGHYTQGDDVALAQAVPGIDIVIGGHSHTALDAPILIDGHRPVVQTGKEGMNLGELALVFDEGHWTVESYALHPIDDTIQGDRAVAGQIDAFKKSVTEVVFASRGYTVDQPLAIAPKDLPNTYTDIAAGTLLANLVTDAFRKATHADIGFTVNGLMRAGLRKGKTGIVTVYDVFAVAPLGAGVVDPTAGSALVTGYFTGLEVKNLLEFFLVDNPAHPGEMFPRASGMKFHYDLRRPKFDAVTSIELGDQDRDYREIDLSGKDERLLSLTTPLYLGLILKAIPTYTKGKLALTAKSKDGRPLKSRVEALDTPRSSTPYVLPPSGTTDQESLATTGGKDGVHEIKEWQAIMDHLRTLPAKVQGKLPVIPVDDRASEVRAIRTA